MGMRKKYCMTAISGNEEKFAKQWCESVMKTAPDLVVINLTQYDDNSEQIYREGIPEDKLVLVKNKWEKNFSTARNQGLDHVPDWVDYCAYLDIDEVFTDDSYAHIEQILHNDKKILLLVDKPKFQMLKKKRFHIE